MIDKTVGNENSSEQNVMSSQVADVFDKYPSDLRKYLVRLRNLILDVASKDSQIGQVTETLKWGQPSYAVSTGTPLRLGVTKSGSMALYAHCQTTVISDARAVFEDELSFEGNRAIVLAQNESLPEGPLRQVIQSALTYRLNR